MKKFLMFFFTFSLLILLPVSAYAETTQEEALRESYHIDEIQDSVPEETKDLLDSLGMSDIDYNNIINISFTQILTTLEEVLLGVYKSPLSSAVSVIAIIILASLIKAFSTSFNESTLSPVLSSSASIFTAVILVVKISACISNACSVIGLSADFTLAFIPVFVFLVAASGCPLTAIGLNSIIFGLAQVLTNIAGAVLMPAANIFLGLGITAGIKPDLHLSSITAFVKKNLVLILSFVTTVFMTIVSVKSNISVNVDALGDKSIRFALSSFVPVIGSTISEGLTAIRGYVSLMKSTVGIFSIVVIFLIFLPSIIEIIIWNIGLSVCGLCSELFEQKSVGAIIKAVQDMLNILLIILIICMVTTIISIGIMVRVKAGG